MPVQKRARPPAEMPLVDTFDWHPIGGERGSRFSIRATVLWQTDDRDGLSANVVVVFCNATDKTNGQEPDKFPPLPKASEFVINSLWLRPGEFEEYDHSAENPGKVTSDINMIMDRLRRKGGQNMQNNSIFHILINSMQDTDGISIYGVGVGTNVHVRRKAARIALGVGYASWSPNGQKTSDEWFPEELREFVAFCRQYNAC